MIGSTGLIAGTRYEQHMACLSCSCGGFRPVPIVTLRAAALWVLERAAGLSCVLCQR